MKKSLISTAKTTLMTVGIAIAQLPASVYAANLNANQQAVAGLKAPVQEVINIFAIVISLIGLFMIIPAVAQWIKNSQNPDAQSQDTPTTRLGIGLVLLVFAGLIATFSGEIVGLVFGS